MVGNASLTLQSTASLVFSTVAAYLLGSLPIGFLLGKLWGVNVLEKGSGRTGGTNVFRAAGLVPALLTGALDVGKGTLAVWLAGQIAGSPSAEVLAGVAVILGHNYSVFLGFHGGAGVGTSLGALGAIYPPAAAGLVVLLLVLIVVTRYASLGSLIVITAMPLVLLVLALTGTVSPTYVLYGLLSWAIIVYAHRPNIQRLIQGKERRINGRGPLRS